MLQLIANSVTGDRGERLGEMVAFTFVMLAACLEKDGVRMVVVAVEFELNFHGDGWKSVLEVPGLIQQGCGSTIAHCSPARTPTAASSSTPASPAFFGGGGLELCDGETVFSETA